MTSRWALNKTDDASVLGDALIYSGRPALSPKTFEPSVASSQPHPAPAANDEFGVPRLVGLIPPAPPSTEREKKQGQFWNPPSQPSKSHLLYPKQENPATDLYNRATTPPPFLSFVLVSQKKISLPPSSSSFPTTHPLRLPPPPLEEVATASRFSARCRTSRHRTRPRRTCVHSIHHPSIHPSSCLSSPIGRPSTDTRDQRGYRSRYGRSRSSSSASKPLAATARA